MRRLVFAALVLAVVPGCVRGGGGMAFGAGLLFGAALNAHSHEHEEVVVTNQIVLVPVPGYLPPPPLPRRDSPDEVEKRVAFDASAAHAALAASSVAACKEHGAPSGWGHAKVTFAGAGSASTVVIDAPRNLPADAVACLGQALGAATVPAFSGGEMSVGATWFVP